MGSRPATTSSTAAAMGAEALPAPTTMTRRKLESAYSRSAAVNPEAVGASALRTAAPGSTAASAAARTRSSAASLSGGGLTRGDVYGFAARQFCRDVPVRRQVALEIALDHLGRNQAVATNPQAGRNARTL